MRKERRRPQRETRRDQLAFASFPPCEGERNTYARALNGCTLLSRRGLKEMEGPRTMATRVRQRVLLINSIRAFSLRPRGVYSLFSTRSSSSLKRDYSVPPFVARVR